MAAAPVNVFIDDPTIEVTDWDTQKERWKRLNTDVGGNPDFSPLTIKAFYVFVVLLSIFKSVSVLLDARNLPSTTYIPAFSLFSSGIDILGRCLRGNVKPWESSKDLKSGFQWLSKPDFKQFSGISLEHELVKTRNGRYKISQLISLRHFTSHGQATSSGDLPEFDFLLLGQFPQLISRGMESYWHQLQAAIPPCDSLAKANIIPFRSRPIFDALWSLSGREFEEPLPIGDIFSRMDWSYKSPVI